MTKIISPEPVNISVETASQAISVMTPQKTSQVIGGGIGRNVQYYRLGLNFDGGNAESGYGDFPILDGGTSEDGSRNPI